jgi:hypothetical protein
VELEIQLIGDKKDFPYLLMRGSKSYRGRLVKGRKIVAEFEGEIVPVAKSKTLMNREDSSGSVERDEIVNV